MVLGDLRWGEKELFMPLPFDLMQAPCARVSNHPARGKDQANVLRKRGFSQIPNRANAGMRIPSLRPSRGSLLVGVFLPEPAPVGVRTLVG